MFPSFDDPMPSLGDDNSRVRVVVRIRPLSPKELHGGHKNILEGGHHRITAWDPTALESSLKPDLAILDAACWSREFAFDRCLWSTETDSEAYASQSDVFDEVGRPVLDWILGGYNCCVFAFGQTGAGTGTTFYITIHCIMPYYITSYRIASYQIKSHCITLQLILSHHITLH